MPYHRSTVPWMELIRMLPHRTGAGRTTDLRHEQIVTTLCSCPPGTKPSADAFVFMASSYERLLLVDALIQTTHGGPRKCSVHLSFVAAEVLRRRLRRF
jgi:hypothetical protein